MRMPGITAHGLGLPANTANRPLTRVRLLGLAKAECLPTVQALARLGRGRFLRQRPRKVRPLRRFKGCRVCRTVPQLGGLDEGDPPSVVGTYSGKAHAWRRLIDQNH